MHLSSESGHESLWPDKALILAWDTHAKLSTHGCFFSHSQEQPQRISILQRFFVLSSMCLSVLGGVLLSCACSAISVQNSFLPDTRDSGISSWSEQAFEHTHIPLCGISSKLILPSLLHGSSFGVHFWSDVLLNSWLRVEGNPLLTTRVAVPNDPFVPLNRTWIVYISCILNTSLGYCNPTENLYFHLYNCSL